MRDTWGQRAVNTANDSENLIKTKFDPLICQCCGHQRRQPEDPECVCAGLDWYLDRDGRIECQAHRFARAVGEPKRVFTMPFFGRKR